MVRSESSDSQLYTRGSVGINILFFPFLEHWEKLDYTLKDHDPRIIYDIHCGSGYRKIGGASDFFTYPEHIGAIFNTDGISVFKSSRLTVWPIYLALASLPPSIRMNKDNLIVTSLWVGHCKPPMHLLLPLFTSELERLSMVGVSVQTASGVKTVRMKPLFGVFDLIAKAPIMNIKQFNGKHGCPTCVHPGTRQHTQLHLPGTTYDLRTDTSIQQAASLAQSSGAVIDGVKGKSALSGFISLVRGIPIDYMHSVLEGIVKWMLDVWVVPSSHRNAYYIGPHVKQIDSQLLQQCPPHDFSRAPRSILKHRKFWKASEFRN